MEIIKKFILRQRNKYILRKRNRSLRWLMKNNTVPYANSRTDERISRSDFSFYSIFFDIANDKYPRLASDIISEIDNYASKTRKR